MNLDDVFCCGATGPALVTSTIGRNRRLVSGCVFWGVQGMLMCGFNDRRGVKVTNHSIPYSLMRISIPIPIINNK
jgi:hypothetical protein